MQYVLGIIILLMVSAVSAENVNLNVVSGTPQNGTYVFECTPTDFNTSTFNWDFGDTVIVPGITGLVQHSYVTDGNYTVMCTGIGTGVNASNSLVLSVNMAATNTTDNTTNNLTNQTNQTGTVALSIASGFPQNMTFMFLCDGTDFAATSRDFTFGDGQQQIGVVQSNVTHSYANAGNYTVNCSATNSTTSGSALLAVEALGPVINDTNQTNTTNQTGNQTNQTNQTGAHITIKAYYPQSGAYIFECNTPGMSPTKYSWHYGDGKKNLDISNQNVFHTYKSNGNYEVICSATDGQNTAHANRSISINDIPYVNTCSAMQNLAASCTGGNITQQDLGKSCRTIICSGNGAEMTILACDKPSADNPLYFDMYKQSATGNNLTICLGDTCIHRNGFARSGLQACFGNNTNTNTNSTNGTGNNATANNTNSTGNQTSGSVSLMVAAGFPQNNSYVFICNATNFVATSHSFDFGDSQQQWNVVANNVYHTYAANGNYSVQCMATDGVTQGNTSLAVTVGSNVAIPNNTVNQTNETNSTGNTTNETNTTIVTTTVSLTGAQEVPPNNSTATGSGTAMLNGTMMTVTGHFMNLEGNVTGAHVHLAPIGVIGPVVIPLDIVTDAGNRSGNFSANVAVNNTVMEAFNNDTLYINVHSELHPSGEIRGQLVT